MEYLVFFLRKILERLHTREVIGMALLRFTRRYHGVDMRLHIRVSVYRISLIDKML